jgi:hypothetical protein
MILVVTDPLDVHADRVLQKIKNRNIDFFRLNTADFPEKFSVSFSYSSTGHAQHILHAGSQEINLSQLKSIWYRRPLFPVPHQMQGDRDSSQYIKEECQTFLDDLWSQLDCLFLPASSMVLKRAQLKALQLKLAAVIGFDLPPTLFTNHPDDFLEFYRQHNGNVVSKLSSSNSFQMAFGQSLGRFTEVVSRREVGYSQAIRYCPMIFQAYVPKRLELRITVVGKQTFAAEIHSQETNHTLYDWRHYDHNKMVYLQHKLPLHIEQQCVQLVEKLGLCFGAIDMILTPDNHYIFLEINPNGQYLWLEEATGLPISDAICDLLITGSINSQRVDQILAMSQELEHENSVAVCIN